MLLCGSGNRETDDRLKLATVAWFKQPLESWRSRAKNPLPTTIAAPSDNYPLPKISEGVLASTTPGPPPLGHLMPALYTRQYGTARK